VEVAVRDIAAGGELTNDYGCFNLIEAFTPKAEGGGRTEVRPDDLLHFHADWDRLIEAALANFPKVRQPLGLWMNQELHQTLREVVEGRRERSSIRELFFEPLKAE
jgi:hypothetical protein